MRYTRFALTTGRPSRSDSVAAAPTHGDNHTSAGQPPPCLSGTIRWYRQNGAAVCDPVSQMAGEPECSTAHATRQDFCKRRLFVVPRQRGRMRNPFFARPNSTASLSISASIVFCPEGAGVREFAYWRQRVRRPAPLPRPMQQPSVNRLNIACAI